jgi:antitoxin component of RelBE/YafQ-DinJ toxin-antitoxin module
MFKPGDAWWVSSPGDDWRQQCPEAQHVCKTIGISISDMNTAFGKQWTGNKGTPFNLFRTQKLGNVSCVDLINELKRLFGAASQ